MRESGHRLIDNDSGPHRYLFSLSDAGRGFAIVSWMSAMQTGFLTRRRRTCARRSKGQLRAPGIRQEQDGKYGSVGGGLEVRVNPHMGWMTDFSWNIVSGSKNNFGLARSGINLAF